MRRAAGKLHYNRVRKLLPHGHEDSVMFLCSKLIFLDFKSQERLVNTNTFLQIEANFSCSTCVIATNKVAR